MLLTRREALATAVAAALSTSSASVFARKLPKPPVSPDTQPNWISAARAALLPGGKIESEMDTLNRQGRFSGVVLAAIDGEPVFQKAYGFSDRNTKRLNTLNTRFNIASAGKMFTAVGIAQLMEEGKLNLHDRLIDLLPDVHADIGAQITISHLLEHTSGFGSYFNAPSWQQRRSLIRSVDDYLAIIADEPLTFSPGERYGYSNSGYILLGAIIEKLRGRNFYTVMRDDVFTPAGMRLTGFPAPDELSKKRAIPYHNGCFGRPPTECTPGEWQDGNGISAVKGGPAGGAFSTVGDLNAFVEALKAGRLLSLQTLDKLKAERGKMTRPGGPLDAYSHGFGRLTIFGHPSWGHNGGTVGAGAQIDIFEDASLTLILLANQDGGQRLGSAVLRRAAAPPG